MSTFWRGPFQVSLLAWIPAAGLSTFTVLSPAPGQGDLVYVGGVPEADKAGRPWFDPQYKAPSPWGQAVREWHPHWCGGAIVDPESELPPQCTRRADLGPGYVAWVAPQGMGWTLPEGEHFYLRREFVVSADQGGVPRAMLWGAGDDRVWFYLNGQILEAGGGSYVEPGLWDVTGLLKPGRNVLAAVVRQRQNQSPCALTYLLELSTRKGRLVLEPLGSEIPPSIGQDFGELGGTGQPFHPAPD